MLQKPSIFLLIARLPVPQLRWLFSLLIWCIFIGFNPALSAAASADACGGLNQRACKVWERFPSCNKWLSEKSGRCVEQPSGCGRLNQRPCNVWEYIPSCQAGLHEKIINLLEFKIECRGDVPTSKQISQLRLQHRLDYQVPLLHATFIGTHNSYNAQAWYYPFPNQTLDIIYQLNAGFRAINFDVHSFGLPAVERLCHFAGDSSLFCSGDDDTFAFGLQQLNRWLSDNPGEVVLLILEDYIDDNRHSQASSDISSHIGAKVYRPDSSGHCAKCPLDTLTKQQVLDAGKQLIITTADNCGKNGGGWRDWVWDINFKDYKADDYKGSDLTRFTDKVGIVYEDRAGIKFGSSAALDSIELAEALRKGAAIIALDFALTKNRHSGAIWSWNNNEPNNSGGNEDCATQISNSLWNDVPCGRSYRYACQSPDNGNWAISGSQGTWSNGASACKSLGNYMFSVPINATENAALNAQRATAGVNTVWLNYNDRAVEGDWVAVSAAQIPNQHPTISLLGAHGKYATAASNGDMNASSSAIGFQEKFRFISNKDGSVSFLSSYGKYASAQPDGTLLANRDALSIWEKFQRINHGDGRVSFKSHHGKYVVAENDGRMNANRTAIGSWEKFRLISASELVIADGIYTVQQASNNRYLDAHESSAYDWRAVTREAQNNPSQQWAIRQDSSGYYTLVQQQTQRYLDAHENGKYDSGAVTRDAQNNASQQWSLIPVGNRRYRIKRRLDALYLGAYVNGNDYHAVLRTNQPGDPSQEWILTMIAQDL